MDLAAAIQWTIPAFGIIAVLFALYLARDVLRRDQGPQAMQDVGATIFEGAVAFIRRQYTTIAGLALVAAVIIAAVIAVVEGQNVADTSVYGLELGIRTGIAFLVGAACSMAAGIIGMYISVKSNVRTAALRVRRSAFTGVRMTGSDLAGSILEDVRFLDCRLDLAFFGTARLSRVRFERCRLDEVDFTEASLSSVAFVDCTLRGSVWTEASLTACELRGSDIAGAVHVERLRGVRMPVADVLAAATDLAAALGIEIVD